VARWRFSSRTKREFHANEPGAVWPFATSQALTQLANFLHSRRDRSEDLPISTTDYFQQLINYANSHQRDGMVYLGEYHDEQTGRWLITGKKALRSQYYNHSTFADLIIFGLVGIIPDEGQMLGVDPLLPRQTWDWFCLDGVPYRGHRVSIVWDKTGQQYRRGLA
jgi:hypothetical protein